jgi:hypothetical protein
MKKQKPTTLKATKRGLHVPGAKDDGGKPRFELTLCEFADAMTEITIVGTDGAITYTDDGWKHVPNGFKRYTGACLRHLFAHWRGEIRDKKSGHLHLAHFAWNAIAILQLWIMSQKPKKK